MQLLLPSFISIKQVLANIHDFQSTNILGSYSHIIMNYDY